MLKSPGKLGSAKLADRFHRSQVLSGLISLCGLRHADVAAIWGVHLQTVRMKVSGGRSISDEDLHALRSFYARIQSGEDPESLPEGAQQVALALSYLDEPPSFDERDLPLPSDD